MSTRAMRPPVRRRLAPTAPGVPPPHPCWGCCAQVGVLQGLRHLRVAWAGPAADAAATSSLAHGPRRLFLDGRPRLGPLLLAALSDLPQLSSLELQVGRRAAS